MKKVNGSQLLKHIKETKFVGILNQNIYFDSNGDPPGRYSLFYCRTCFHFYYSLKNNKIFIFLMDRYVILNVQKETNKLNNTARYFYREVGNWNNNDKIDLNIRNIILPGHDTFRSMCSAQCEFGHVKVGI